MRLNITSLKSRMLLVSSLSLTIPVVGMVLISYGYWDKRQQEEQFLQQQHALNFCIQDLENSIFYSRVSELSNLSIIRNELFRLYRIVDLSAQYTRVADLNLSASHARSALIAPSPSPHAMSVASNQENTDSGRTIPPSRLERDDRSKAPLNDSAGTKGQGTTINRNTGRVDSPYITDLKETVALLDGTTGASIISALDKAHSGDFTYHSQYDGSDVTIPMPLDARHTENSTSFAEALDAAHDTASDPSRFVNSEGQRVDAISQGGLATIGAAPFKNQYTPAGRYHPDYVKTGSASVPGMDKSATSSDLYLESLAHSMENKSKDASAAGGENDQVTAGPVEEENDGGNIVKLDPLFDRSLLAERQRQLDNGQAQTDDADVTGESDTASSHPVSDVQAVESSDVISSPGVREAHEESGLAGLEDLARRMTEGGASAPGTAASAASAEKDAHSSVAEKEAASENFGIIYSPIPQLSRTSSNDGYGPSASTPSGTGIHGSVCNLGDAIRAPGDADVAAAAAQAVASGDLDLNEEDNSLSIRRPIVDRSLERYSNFFISPADDPNESFLIGAESPDFNNNRIKLQSHLTQLNKLGFIAFSINTRNPEQDIFIKNRDRVLLDELANDERTLSNILYNNNNADHSFFVILKSVRNADTDDSPVAPGMYNRLSGEYEEDEDIHRVDVLTSDDDSFISANMGSPVTADNIVGLDSDGSVIKSGTVISDSQASGPHHKDDGHNHAFNDDDPRFNNDIQERNLRYSTAASIAAERDYLQQRDVYSSSSGAQAENETDAITTGAKAAEEQPLSYRQAQRRHSLNNERAFLAIVAPLSLSSNQLIVIITDISKLKQQEDTLKRLISNSLNETVLSNSITSPYNITLIDSDLNPLAGTLKNRDDIVSLLDEDLILEARLRGAVQFYDPDTGQYASLGAFKNYNWFVLINSDNSRMTTQLYWFLALVGIAGLIFALIIVIVLVKTTSRDADDIKLINNKIKHLATLLQDPVLLQRICDSLPKRNDEIGALSSQIRLMGKTVYQSIQEILQINKARDMEESEKHYIDQLRHSAVNREIFLKESFSNTLNVHTEACYQGASDFYDVFELGDHRLAIFVGSINDAGALSTNIALINIALIRQLIRLSESIRLPLGRAMQELNQNIVDNNPKSILTSVCIIIVDQRNGNVEYFNAGHNLPIIYKKEQGFDYIDCRTAPVIGAAASENFKSMTFSIDDGDSILLYTDGVMDCENFKGDSLGQVGFENMLHDESFISPVETVNSLTTKIKRFTRDRKQTRDYTLLCYQLSKIKTGESKKKM